MSRKRKGRNHGHSKRRKKKDNNHKINRSTISTLIQFDQADHILAREKEPFHRHKRIIDFILSLNDENSDERSAFFYDVLPNNTFISFHKVHDDFNIDQYSKHILKRLDCNLNGIWRITHTLEDEMYEHHISDISMYKMNDVRDTKSPKRVQIHRNIWCKSIGSTVVFNNIFDHRNQATVSFGNWGYAHQNAHATCIIIKLINCEYAVHTSLPLDYRSRNSHYTFGTAIPYESCLLFDFNDKGRSPFITPRMAYKIFDCGIQIIDRLSLWTNWCLLGFPDCCEPYLKKLFWKQSFVVAMKRVLIRLKNGMNFKCNCTAEEMAVHLILNEIQTYEEEPDEYEFWTMDDAIAYDSLPDYGTRDTKWDDLCDVGLEDHDVLMLFNPKLKDHVLDHNTFLYQHMNFVHLHPSTWFVPFRYNEFDIDFIQKPLNEATIWMHIRHKIEMIESMSFITRTQFTWNSWNQMAFIEHIWNDVNHYDLDTCFVSMLLQHHSLLSMAFNRKMQTTHGMLNELNRTIRNIQYLDEITQESMMIFVFIIFYRLDDKCFEYLQNDLRLYDWLCNDYYLHLFQHSTHGKEQSFVLHFYCVLLSIMTKKLYHDKYHYDDASTENEEYVMQVMDKIPFEALYGKNTCDSSCYRMDQFRGVVTCCVNRKVSRSNYKHLMLLVCRFRYRIRCFNDKCGKLSNAQQKLKVCDRCMVARYCSKQCQKKHWKVHKPFCSVF
eukprot:33185_1